MKQYGLRKIWKDGKHYGFQWPLEVGAIVTAPDWNPEAECGGGLHVLPNAHGDYGLLSGYYWAVVEYDADSLVMIDNQKGKVPSCNIVYLSESPDGLLEYFKDVQFDSIGAYYWAMYIGDHEYMKQFVTDPEYAYYWALYMGDREYMKQFVNEAECAYLWAAEIGDREYMKQFVNEAEWAYVWAKYIGDREYMKQFVTDPEYAYYWAKHIGDREYMKQFVVGTVWDFAL